MKNRILTLVSFLLLLILLTGCSASIPKPASSGDRPSLLYQPSRVVNYGQKYPVTLGVMNLREARSMPFYGGKDHYFKEDTLDGLSELLYYELSASGLFASVRRIPEAAPEDLSVEQLLKIKNQYGVDLIFVADLTEFNLLRLKLNPELTYNKKLQVDDMEITVSFAILGQLLYPNKAYVIWSDSIQRDRKSYAEDGALEPEELGQLTREMLKSAMKDVKLLIANTGKKMRKK